MGESTDKDSYEGKATYNVAPANLEMKVSKNSKETAAELNGAFGVLEVFPVAELLSTSGRVCTGNVAAPCLPCETGPQHRWSGEIRLAEEHCCGLPIFGSLRSFQANYYCCFVCKVFCVLLSERSGVGAFQASDPPRGTPSVRLRRFFLLLHTGERTRKVTWLTL